MKIEIVQFPDSTYGVRRTEWFGRKSWLDMSDNRNDWLKKPLQVCRSADWERTLRSFQRNAYQISGNSRVVPAFEIPPPPYPTT